LKFGVCVFKFDGGDEYDVVDDGEEMSLFLI
jgi:hypothetical protein